MFWRNNLFSIVFHVLSPLAQNKYKSGFSVIQCEFQIFLYFLVQAFSPLTERLCIALHLSLWLFPLKLSLSPPLVPIHPTPTAEVKPYSWINLAAVWPNVHWHTSLHLSLSHDVYLSLGSSLPGGLLYRQMEGFNLYTKTMTSYWHYFTTLTWRFIL